MTIMHNQYPILLDFDLHLFDGAAGGAAGAAAPAGEAAGGESALPKAETNKRPGSSRRAKAGAFDNVVFGKQEDASAAETATNPVAGDSTEGNGANKSGVSTTSDTLEAKRAAFEEMISGEYKDIFQEKFQKTFNRRYAETKSMEQTIAAQKPVMDMLMQRYNIADGDIAKLQTALEQDSTYWENAAENAGLTVEQFKAMQKLERENAELREIRQKEQHKQQAQQQLNVWVQEAETLKGDYPHFDLRSEIENPQFLDLLKAKIPMKHAYELLHMEEIKTAEAKRAAETASQQMQANIKAKASRPAENGTSHQSAVITKSDVHGLSRMDRAEIARRVQRGEKIKF